MRIGLNLIGFTPGCGGVETYLTSLIAALQKVDHDNEYILLCDEVAASAFVPVSDRFRIHIFRYQQQSFRWFMRGIFQRTLGYDILKRDLLHLPVDVMHHTLTVLNPPGLPYPSVLTFHDMQQEYFPQFFSSQELAKRRESYLPSVIESKALIALSLHAKTCLVEKYGIDPLKIHVIHSGCGEDCRERDPGTLVDLIQRYNLQQPFIIYPAATWPHKNHSRLLKALRLLVERRLFEGELLLTGAQKEAHGEMKAEIASLGLTDKVRWLGYIPRSDLLCLYNLARFMVFPSLFEGFGLPVVEAMASGCPVACSHTTSLPEIAGDAAIYFDPMSVEDMAGVIGTLWSDSSLQKLHIKLGVERSTMFRWEEAAAKTVTVYRQALTG